MKRILLSLGMIVFVGGIVAGATGAFFSDTETSTGNTFAAGDIDLKIDNESYAIDFNVPDFNGEATGQLVFNPATSWDLTDLVAGTHKFFDFYDLKPGDWGEDTISIHVGSNDAWMCAAARITDDSDQSLTEPELADDTATSTPPGAGLGELDSELNFAFWNDDGDNVYEPVCGTDQTVSCVPETIFLSGPLSGLGAQGQITLASPTGGAFGNSPVPGNTDVFIGKAWCFGTMGTPGIGQDGSGKTGTGTGDSTNGPIERPGSVTCNGATVNNAAQTDQVQGDMQFYAVQARNNAKFSCEVDYRPDWGDDNI